MNQRGEISGAVIIVILFLLILISAAYAPRKVYTVADVLGAYKKGLKVGRVIGREDILSQLKSPDCFTQKVDELMSDSEKPVEAKETK